MPPQAPAPFRQAPASAAAVQGEARWMVSLLGGVRAHDGVQTLDRFPSRAVAALLARLAMAPGRAHAREELAELLWPGAAPDVGRNRLRQALSTLKSLLEPAHQPGSRVLLADRVYVRVAPGALDCDVLRFERLARAGQADEAAALYGGELMPGHYGDWIETERQRLAGLAEQIDQRRLPSAGAVASASASAATGASVTSAASAASTASAASAASAVPLASMAPAAASASLPHSPVGPPLPAYLTRLFGAELATARLRALVLQHRLVSLLGPGGSGKTRLGVEVAQALRHPPSWPADGGSVAAAGFDAVAFVSLVGCQDAPQLLDAIAHALRLPGADRPEAVQAALSGLRVLLVLDNFEQLVGRAESVVAELLTLLPQLRILVTSRRRLGLDGEVLFQAEPLALPPEEGGLAEAAANPAVALFADRARAVRSEFHLTERHCAAVIGLVRLLHGLPLAIELAASRVRSFPPAELLRLLSLPAGGGQLSLLERGGARSALDPRHASMTQVIAWSWQLLDPASQHTLTALAVMGSSASAAAVAAVTASPLAQAAARLDALVDHSLVRVASGSPTGGGAVVSGPLDGASDSARFDIVEPVREFALQHAGAQAAALRARLRDWLLGWAADLGPLPSPARVAPELAHVHAMLASAEADGAPRQAVQLAVSLRAHFDHDALPVRLLLALESALRTLPAADPLRADAHELLAYLRFGTGFVAEARAHADAALAAAGSAPAPRARALVRRAWVDIAAGRAADRATPQHAQVRAQLQEALDLARTSGDLAAQALALQQLGVLAGHVHASAAGADVAGAEALFAQAQALWLALGDRRRAHARLRNRAQCWRQLGRSAEAMAAYRQCEQVALAEGDWIGQIDSLISMAELLAQQRQWQAALDANRRCLALCWQRWFRHGLAYALWNPPRVLARLGQPEAAVQLMAFASVFWTRQFGPLVQEDERHIRRLRGVVTRQIGAQRCEALWHQGLALDVASAVRLVLQGR